MRLPKINVPKKYYKIGAWVLGVFFLLLFSLGAIAYSKREAMLKKMMAKVIAKAKNEYGLTIQV